MSSCNNRVVVITGAGGGLGRAYALAFAAEGAKVVVNDINRYAAEAVVAQIREQDGQAIANSNDITHYEDAGRIVAAALEAFGGLDVVVNNAGICRDRMFASLTEADWDAVVAVHLKGTSACPAMPYATGASRPKWRQGRCAHHQHQLRRGPAGLDRQSNYAAAKGGIASLTLVQAAELARYGITVNALAPAARTGMTEGVFGEVMKSPKQALITSLRRTSRQWWCGWARANPLASPGRCSRSKAANCPSPTAGGAARWSTTKAVGPWPRWARRSVSCWSVPCRHRKSTAAD